MTANSPRTTWICLSALLGLGTVTSLALPARAAEYHVSKAGTDDNPGTKALPFRTISAAARIAQPGDVITAAPSGNCWRGASPCEAAGCVPAPGGAPSAPHV